MATFVKELADLGQNTNFSAMRWEYKIHFSFCNFYGNENTFHKNVKKYKLKYFHFPKLKIQKRISVDWDLSFTIIMLNWIKLVKKIDWSVQTAEKKRQEDVKSNALAN